MAISKENKNLENIEETSSGNRYRESSEYIKKVREEQKVMSMGGHLDELRFRLMRSVFWIAFFSTATYFIFPYIWHFIMDPLVPLIKSKMVSQITTRKITDKFFIQFKVILLSGVLMALPMILFEIWGFIIPALDKVMKRVGNGILFLAVILFWSGVLFCRVFVWMSVTTFLATEWELPFLNLGNEVIKTNLLLDINEYLSFFSSFHLAFGLGFEMPVVSIILALIGVLKAKFFFQSWRIAIVIIAIASAVLTPADVFSMIALMVPLLILFFVSGVLVYFIEKYKIKKEEKFKV